MGFSPIGANVSGQGSPAMFSGVPKMSGAASPMRTPQQDLLASNSGGGLNNHSKAGGGSMPTFGGTSIAASQLDFKA